MKKKILVVDDNRQMLELMANLLEDEGHQVVTAEDGLSALTLLTSFSPDIMFVDLVMPQIGGDKLCRIVRTMGHLQDCYLVLVTAAAAELEFDYEAIGADICIAKGPSGSIVENVLKAVEKSDSPPGERRSKSIMGLDELYPRQLTKELLSRNRHLETILERMAEGIMEVVSGKVVFANSAAISLFGQPQEKLLASYFLDLFDETLRPQVESMLKAEIDKPSEIGQDKSVEFNHRQVTIKCLPVEGDTSTTIVILTDVTERIRLQTKLEMEAEKLEEQSSRLKEANTALKVLLEQSEVHKKELEDNFLSNVQELVNPHLERLKKSRLNSLQSELISAIGSSLDNIASPFINKLSLKHHKLTSKEIRVANLIKAGKKNKEIAEIVGLSHNTILFHRFNIRTKLGLRNKKVNLKAYLASFNE